MLPYSPSCTSDPIAPVMISIRFCAAASFLGRELVDGPEQIGWQRECDRLSPAAQLRHRLGVRGLGGECLRNGSSSVAL